MRVASFYGLMESTLGGRAALRADDAGLVALGGRRRRERVLVPVARWPTSRSPSRSSGARWPPRGRLDAQAATRLLLLRRAGSPIRTSATPATAFIWGGGRLADAWPAAPDEDEYSRVRTSNVETLLIGGELDFATPPQVATKELLPHLPNGHQVVLPGFGHSTTFWTEQPEAGTPADQHLPRQRPGRRLALRAAERRLHARGHADRARQGHRRRDGRPRAPHGAFAAVDGSPRAQARTLRTQGRARRCGRVYPIVLGLGGWFLGVLIVITTMPGVPLDDELLAALSVGVPIGLGIYFAWVNRDWSAKTKTTGFAAAVGGALVGALARVQRNRRAPRAHHRDRRSGRRREPDRCSSSTSLGSAGSRSLRRNQRQGDPGGAPLDRLMGTRRGEARPSVARRNACSAQDRLVKSCGPSGPQDLTSCVAKFKARVRTGSSMRPEPPTRGLEVEDGPLRKTAGR